VSAVQFIITPGGEELAILPRAEFDRLAALAAEAEEDAVDVAAYDAAKAEFAASGSVAWPPELSALLLKHKSRLAAVRRWRGFAQAELAAKAGIQQGYLSDLESRRRRGLPATIERLALALDVPVDWIN
jgi:ribosome-binding protein aMBF1 (putative translation factor)